MQEKPYMQEEEVSIREYINIIIKRRKVILTIFFIFISIAIITSLLIPRVYEINSTIRLGSIDKLLINKDEAKEIMLNQNLLFSIIEGLGINKIDVEHFKKYIKIEDVKDTNLLTIKIRYSNVAKAFKINDEISAPLISQGQSIYQERISIINIRLKELFAQIEKVSGDIERTQKLIIEVPNTPSVSQSEESLRILLLQNSLPTYETYLTSLKNERYGLQLLLSDAKEFKIIESPITPKHAIWPNKRKIVAMSGMIGLISGLFFAFFMEYWGRSKRT